MSYSSLYSFIHSVLRLGMQWRTKQTLSLPSWSLHNTRQYRNKTHDHTQIHSYTLYYIFDLSNQRRVVSFSKVRSTRGELGLARDETRILFWT